MKLGITGHRELDNPDWVKQELHRIINLQNPPIIGFTSLAVGTDQLFAQALLDCAGIFQVIVPCEEYIKAFDLSERVEYERLLSKAASIEVLPMAICNEDAFFLAGKKVIDISDLIIAVWDGKPAAGLGGTADIVEYAKLHSKSFIHINPVKQETILFV